MPDLRYHVISLISVFLALSIGLLLGIALADRGVITDQLQSEVTNIQRQLDDQRELIAERDGRIAELEERTSADEQLMQDLADTVVSASLNGVDVALVSGPWVEEQLVQDIQQTLTSEAGADLASYTSLPPPTVEDAGPATGPDRLETRILYLQEAREVLGLTTDADSPEVIVFVGGGEPPPETPEGSLEALEEAQRAMLEVWQEAGVRVVTAQPSYTERNEVPLFEELGIPSVDNADRAAGQAAVVQLANSTEDGAYGTRSTASEPFPPAPS